MSSSHTASQHPRHPVDELATFLEDKAQYIRSLETSAHTALHEAKDHARYRELLLQKATLLQMLAQDAEVHVAALPEVIAQAVRERLERFVLSASNALRIDSIFYMSALLYRENHKEGEKNDLECYADEVRHIRY